MEGIIYCITNTINQKKYIGKSFSTIEKRFKEHLSDSNKKRCNNRPLYKAISKYGKEYFTIELLGTFPEKELIAKEMEFIQKYDTYKKGYNATLGGDGKKHLNLSKEELEKVLKDSLNINQASKKLNIDSKTLKTYATFFNLEELVLSKKGIKPILSSVNEKQAIRIKYDKEKVKDLINELGISKFVIHRIRKNKSWKHI